jgi:hypothetical protein
MQVMLSDDGLSIASPISTEPAKPGEMGLSILLNDRSRSGGIGIGAVPRFIDGEAIGDTSDFEGESLPAWKPMFVAEVDGNSMWGPGTTT